MLENVERLKEIARAEVVAEEERAIIDYYKEKYRISFNRSVPEILDLITRIQDPKQKEIRERQRREQHRDNVRFNDAAQITAQIITLAG